MSIPLAYQARVYNDIKAITSLFRDEGFNDIRLLCHDQRDISFAASFQDIEYIYTGDVYTYLSLLKSCALNVTYRLHAFLPCLAFDTPSIKISYDERALSMIETIGYGSWDINMIQESDVISAVKNRFGRIMELNNMKDQARSKWDDLFNTMREVFNSFAADVKELARR
jgi:polysaccharide pyruvyl transferase WcaK-like protein